VAEGREGMMYQAGGIETHYRGYRFRSRAEARWAAFFDLIGWKWNYEPVDLEGYIPDFVLDFNVPLIVEVKGGALCAADLDDHKAKLELTSWQWDALLVGASPLKQDHNNFVAGLLSYGGATPERQRMQGADWWWCNGVMFHCLECDRVSVLHESGFWVCRICGGYRDGNGHVAPVNANDLSTKWAAASNATRWR
jgi:hypothetical protein